MRLRQDGERTRLEILGAARSIFAERGFSGTSIKAIADFSGVSQSLILHHFKGGKDALWAETKIQAVSTFASAFTDFENSVPITEAHTREVFQTYFNFCLEHPELMKIGLWVRVTEGTSEDWGGESELFSNLAAFASEAQTLGYLRHDLPVFDLLMIFSGAVKSWIFDGQHFLNLSGSQTSRQKADLAFFDSAFRVVTKQDN